MHAAAFGLRVHADHMARTCAGLIHMHLMRLTRQLLCSENGRCRRQSADRALLDDCQILKKVAGRQDSPLLKRLASELLYSVEAA